jgi:hypothetical protein
MARPQSATWNREDRDLLIELKTQMQTMFGEIAAARVEIKEINTGITARLLNLEANAVSKIEVFPKLDEFSKRMTALEDSRIEYRATIKAWLIIGGTVQFLFATGLAIYFHYY